MKKIKTAVVLHNETKDDSPGDILDVRVQADWISEILSELGYETIKLPFTPDCVGKLTRQREIGPFFAFNLVDSAPGEDNLVYLAPSILEAMKIPYTGCSAEALFVTTDKVLTKKLLRIYGLPTPEWVTKDDGVFVPNRQYIVKPLREDASIGLDNQSVVFAETRGDLVSAIARREARDAKAYFAERFIDGREFTVCAYGMREDPVIMPPYEWVFPGFRDSGIPEIISYDAKWTENTFEYDNLKAVYRFPEESNTLIAELVHLSRICYRKFDLNGYARIDFRVDELGRPWILEINGNPSFYGFYNVARAYGLEFAAIVGAVVDLAVGKEGKA